MATDMIARALSTKASKNYNSFSDRNAFPEVGESGQLYLDTEKGILYYWNEEKNDYGMLLSIGDNDYVSRIIKLEDYETAHKTEYETLNNIVSGHTSEIAKKANQTDLDNIVSRISTTETAIVEINTEINKKANSIDVYTKTEVNNIIGTPDEGKTLVQMIYEAQTEATYDDTQIKINIKSNSDAIAILNSDDKTEGSVLSMISANAPKIATIDIAGLVKSVANTVENGVSVAEDGTMTVNSINVNKLVQDKDSVLILNGGSANI